MRRLFAALLLLVTSLPAAAAPQRVVTIGGGITEIAFALGAGNRIVAVDTTSLVPEAARALPQVGYQRALSAEGVLAQHPDLVLAVHGAGPAAALDQLRAAGVMIQMIDDAPTFAALLARVDTIAVALDATAQAAPLKIEIARQATALEQRVASMQTHPRALLLLSAARGAPMAAGRNTAADAALRLAGGINVMTEQGGFEGYKPVAPEALAAAAPDVIVVPDHALEALGGVDGVLAIPGLAQTTAGRMHNVVVVDSLAALGFGPRTPAAITALAEAMTAHKP